MSLNVMVIVWEEAAERDVVSPFLLAVSAAWDHQDAVGDGAAAPGVGDILLGQQGRDAHHLRRLLVPPDLVPPRRQPAAQDDGRHHEDGGQYSQRGDGDETRAYQAAGGAWLDVRGAGRDL